MPNDTSIQTYTFSEVIFSNKKWMYTWLNVFHVTEEQLHHSSLTNVLSTWCMMGAFHSHPNKTAVFSLPATSSCNHFELAPRHKHSLGYISTGFSHLSSFKPHTHMHAHVYACTCIYCNPIWSLSHPNAIFTEGLSTTSTWCKNIRCIIKETESDWLRARTCDKCQPIDRMEDNEDWVTCITATAVWAAYVCMWYLYQQRKCQCKKVRTLGKHLSLQDQGNVLLNVRSVVHRCEYSLTHTHSHVSKAWTELNFSSLPPSPLLQPAACPPGAEIKNTILHNLCQSKWSRKENQRLE